MAKVKVRLAFWHAGHKPGDVVEVEAHEVAQMRVDGRVAEVMPKDAPKSPAPAAAKAPEVKKVTPDNK